MYLYLGGTFIYEVQLMISSTIDCWIEVGSIHIRECTCFIIIITIFRQWSNDIAGYHHFLTTMRVWYNNMLPHHWCCYSSLFVFPGWENMMNESMKDTKKSSQEKSTLSILVLYWEMHNGLVTLMWHWSNSRGQQSSTKEYTLFVYLKSPFNLTTATGCYVTGWGKTAENITHYSPVLNELQVDIVSKEVCNRNISYNGNVPGEYFCAGFPGGERDSCSGDSGGPLVCPNNNGQYLLTGVVEWGYGCARPHKYGVYIDVRKILPFIEGTTEGKKILMP